MSLNERLREVTVLGAGGKMGRGIALLLAQEMTILKLSAEQAGQTFRLNLIDVNPDALEDMKTYLHTHAQKFVQKNQEWILQRIGQENISPDKLASRFQTAFEETLAPATDLNAARNSRLVFEAVLENVKLKVSLFKQLKKICPSDAFYFSNTSSIPIHELNDQAGLDGHIIGFHFYNPPPVQKLVELIIPEKVHPDLPPLAKELGKRLGKILIPSKDVAGFIGNGHFSRDGLYAISQAETLQAQGLSHVQAIYTMNRISQDFLIRPMGIFQLIDYVGIDVFQSILSIMNQYLPGENLHSDLIDDLVKRGIKGGQFADGSQKDGFLKYEEGSIVGIYDLQENRYLRYDEGDWKAQADEKIGPLPEGHEPWKTLVKDPDRDAKLHQYFAGLKNMSTLGARLALEYLDYSRKIAEKLVTDGVARSSDDVNKVLMFGFYHLYGPINDFLI